MACSSGAAEESENVGLVAHPANDAASNSIVTTPETRFRELVSIRISRL
jgi:hypothetical protein